MSPFSKKKKKLVQSEFLFDSLLRTGLGRFSEYFSEKFNFYLNIVLLMWVLGVVNNLGGGLLIIFVFYCILLPKFKKSFLKSY